MNNLSVFQVVDASTAPGPWQFPRLWIGDGTRLPEQLQCSCTEMFVLPNLVFADDVGFQKRHHMAIRSNGLLHATQASSRPSSHILSVNNERNDEFLSLVAAERLVANGSPLVDRIHRLGYSSTVLFGRSECPTCRTPKIVREGPERVESAHSPRLPERASRAERTFGLLRKADIRNAILRYEHLRRSTFSEETGRRTLASRFSIRPRSPRPEARPSARQGDRPRS